MLAEQCSRYEDMMTFLEDMVKTKTEDYKIYSFLSFFSIYFYFCI